MFRPVQGSAPTYPGPAPQSFGPHYNSNPAYPTRSGFSNAYQQQTGNQFQQSAGSGANRGRGGRGRGQGRGRGGGGEMQTQSGGFNPGFHSVSGFQQPSNAYNPSSGFTQPSQMNNYPANSRGFSQPPSGFGASSQKPAFSSGFVPIQGGAPGVDPSNRPVFGPESNFVPQATNSGFSQSTPTAVGGFTQRPPSSMSPVPNQSVTPSAAPAVLSASSLYSEESELTVEEKTAYSSPSFRLGAVPLHAPTKALAET